MKNDEARRIVEEEGLCSLSNNTKWRRLVPLIASLPCRKRIKFINADESTDWGQWISLPSPGYVEAAGGGPESLKFIEWIEIEKFESVPRGRLVQPVLVDHSQAIASSLREAHASVRETESSFLVMGYSRPAAAH